MSDARERLIESVTTALAVLRMVERK